MLLSHISAILAGFSVVSVIILLFTYLFFLKDMRKTITGKVACCFMLIGLAMLQWAHYLFFVEGVDLLLLRSYCLVLVMLPISFFFFSREILFLGVLYRWRDIVHLIPLVLSFVLPIEAIPGFAFLIGTIYTFWFVRVVYSFRDQRGRFKFEMFFFGMFAVMAFTALLLGLLLPFIDQSIFYITYSNAISIAVVLIVAALLVFPELLSDILLITELAYAKTKLKDINVEQAISELEYLMIHEKQYENEELSLATVAELLNLSSHQLSELINTEYGYGFPRFIREHRVRAAKTLLISEPNASILSISMTTGFKSQSSFYTAFKEATGESPGHYRGSRLP